MEVIPFAKCRLDGDCLKCPFRGKAIVYGPFKSHRRGVSIGINLFPYRKVCSFNCVYCFRGFTEVKTLKLAIPPYSISPVILREALEKAINTIGNVDAIDFSGNGEPTLHPKLKTYINTVKEFVKEKSLNVSIGIFTNSTTLFRSNIIKILKELDHVEAKLDTVIEWKFRVINRPHKLLSIKKIIEGLVRFRKVFEGTLAIQIMLLKYDRVNNYGFKDARLIGETLLTIEPDIVHVYVPYRIPRLSSVSKPSKQEVAEFSKILREHGLKVKSFI